MQFIVFAAFAIVLSIPEGGPPWATLTSPWWILAGVVGQIVLAGGVGWFGARLVKSKLEREPAWLPGAQRRLAKANVAIRVALVVGLAGSLYLTDLVRYVGGIDAISSIWGLDEIVVLVPFFLSIIAAWVGLYPADRAVRQVSFEQRLLASAPARPVWSLRKYLSFMCRQHVLIIAVPMVPIVVANDFVSTYAVAIRKVCFGLLWADQALLVAIAGTVFLMAPVMLCHIWHTKPLPPGELRERLETLCRRVGMRYRRILIWESDGMVVNAAVMGLFRPVRYILLSDGLLEMMEDQKIEAVFGHEVGHIKHRHIQFYLFFAVLSMLVVGGIAELVYRAMHYWPALTRYIPEFDDYLQVAVMALIVIIWAFGFGVISRRFEWQADLFGARCVTPDHDGCDQPCYFHGTAIAPVLKAGKKVQPLCATAAATFAQALYRIAMLNGIPVEARSWRHSSIGNRMQRLKEYGYKPDTVGRLERSVAGIKAFLLVGVMAGLAIAVALYWPQDKPDKRPMKKRPMSVSYMPHQEN